jgi:hypothetical protein
VYSIRSRHFTAGRLLPGSALIAYRMLGRTCGNHSEPLNHESRRSVKSGFIAQNTNANDLYLRAG